MDRWTRTQGERVEFWEVRAESEVLREQWGVEGQATQTREQRCDNAATCERIRLRMVAQREREGFVASAPAQPSTSASEGKAKREVPTFGDLPPKKLASIALKLDAIRSYDGHKHRMELSKSVPWEQVTRLAWHLVEHRAVSAETNLGLLAVLAESPEGASVETVFALLARLPSDAKKLYPKSDSGHYFTDGSCREVDALLFANVRRAAGLFEAREAELAPWVRLALDFARGRAGIELPAERKKRVLEQIARNQCTQWGLTTGWELPMLDGDTVIQRRMQQPEDVRAVALLFGSEAEWSAAMVRYALELGPDGMRPIQDALAACDARQLAQLLSKPFSFSDNTNLAYVIGVVEKRSDSPEALLDAAQTLSERTDLGKEIRELLAVIAARRFGEAGKPVPEALDPLLKFDFFSGVYFESIRPYIAGLKAIPRDRVHALVRRRIAQPYQYSAALAGVIAHPDEDLLREIFAMDGANCFLDARIVGEVGSAALEHLWTAWEQTPKERRRSRAQQIIQALATAADRGEPIDPKWDDFVRFDDEGGEKMDYWDDRYTELRRRVVAGMPAERRHALVLARLEKDKHPLRSAPLLNVCDDETLERGVRAVLERRGKLDRPALGSALLALGDRLVPALVAARDTFANDKDFLGLLRERMPAPAFAALVAALANVGQS
ncbi:MAG: hypothetical protein JNK05_11920 [Myxococcales bacterium]|nr:hypothetical protein [Myxococcales bacterium]